MRRKRVIEGIVATLPVVVIHWTIACNHSNSSLFYYDCIVLGLFLVHYCLAVMKNMFCSFIQNSDYDTTSCHLPSQHTCEQKSLRVSTIVAGGGAVNGGCFLEPSRIKDIIDFWSIPKLVPHTHPWLCLFLSTTIMQPTKNTVGGPS